MNRDYVYRPNGHHRPSFLEKQLIQDRLRFAEKVERDLGPIFTVAEAWKVLGVVLLSVSFGAVIHGVRWILGRLS